MFNKLDLTKLDVSHYPADEEEVTTDFSFLSLFSAFHFFF